MSALPDELDAETTQQIAGNSWDEATFVEIAGSIEATITREEFLAAVQKHRLSKKSSSLNLSASSPVVATKAESEAIKDDKTTSWKKTPPSAVRHFEKRGALK